MELQAAPDIKRRVVSIIKTLQFTHLDSKRIFCMRSSGSKSQARARIYSFPRIWQKALNIEAHYIIEVLSEKFDKLNYDNQTKVMIHELLHIPKNFSGALLPHRGRGKRKIDHQSIETLFKQFKKLK